ncbi:MAG: orotate phosphoribosyltransferase [Desulfobacterales bacterium]|nr:orotate phosphoribosyltransferase [Desulfobacterales bacterium]
MKNEMTQLVAGFLWETGAIKISVDKPFQMTSGKFSPFYIDCRLLISFPIQRDIITLYAQWVCEENRVEADYLAGGETAGIPFAAWLAEKTGKPFVYVRKSPKGHGLTSQIEGKTEPGKTVLLYEDLITDGKSKLNFISGIRQAGCGVEHCLVILDRQEGGARLLADQGVQLHALLTIDNCFDVGLKNGFLSARDMDIINGYREKRPS